mmetsp:Transcript_10856/g.24987  ORF Transcript_10856/g.24987 Transcript_10856/m.24987 type:complete len:375 (-) Transcript_10856:417-1541(-)
MSTVDNVKTSSSGHARIELSDFPGEEPLTHEGNSWKMDTITRLSPHELVAVAETGILPALSEIIDIDIDTFPELPADHPQHERRRLERIKILTSNMGNEERRRRVTLRAWTTLFESLRSSCVKKAPLLANELYELCALSSRGIPGGYFDGPRAWAILMGRVDGGAVERQESDKAFYSTAPELQKSNPLPDGCTSTDYTKKAFAYVQYIMPNLAQKYEPADAAEYILKMMPPGLYEAGQRIKFSLKTEGRFTDLKYLIRQCATEVFQKQKGSVPKPTFVAADLLGGHELQLMSLTTGIDLQCDDAPDAAFAGFSTPAGKKSWCPKCPHPGGSCICDPRNNKPPPPSVYEDKSRWRDLMALRGAKGAQPCVCNFMR